MFNYWPFIAYLVNIGCANGSIKVLVIYFRHVVFILFLKRLKTIQQDTYVDKKVDILKNLQVDLEISGCTSTLVEFEYRSEDVFGVATTF